MPAEKKRKLSTALGDESPPSDTRVPSRPIPHVETSLRKARLQSAADPLSWNKKFEQGNLASADESMFQSGFFANLTVRSGERSWHIHKSVVPPRYTFFIAAVSEGFKEAETNVISMDYDDPEAIDHMLRWLYTQKVHIPLDLVPWEVVTLLVAVIRVADKYCLPGLIEKCLKELERRVGENPNQTIPELVRAVYDVSAVRAVQALKKVIPHEIIHFVLNKSIDLGKTSKLAARYPELAAEVLRITMNGWRDLLNDFELESPFDKRGVAWVEICK